MSALSFERKAQYGYDFSEWPVYRYIDLTIDNGLTPASFVVNSATSVAQVQRTVGTLNAYTEDFPTFQSNDTNMTLLHMGDNSAMSTSYNYLTPIDAIVDQIATNFAAAINVSAATAGNFSLTNVELIFTSFRTRDTSQSDRVIRMNAVTTAIGGLGSAGNNGYAILNMVSREQFRLYSTGFIRIEIIQTVTTGTGTFQNGILASFPYHGEGGLRTYSKSGILLQMRPFPGRATSTLLPAQFAEGWRS